MFEEASNQIQSDSVCFVNRNLCERLEEVPLAYTVSSHKLFMELLQDEEKKILLDQIKKRSATVNLSAKPLPSFYDIPGSPSSPDNHYRSLKGLNKL